MDWNPFEWNDHFLKFWMNLGYYDTRTLQIERRRLIVNRFILINLLICSIKMFIYTIFINLFSIDLRPYLIEMFIFNANDQKHADIGLSIIHFGFFLSFFFWTKLNRNAKMLMNLNFLFLFNLKETCKYFNQHYQLDKKSTQLFLSRSYFYRSFIKPLTIFYFIACIFFIFRCLYQAYCTVSLVYFLFACLFLAAITLLNYLFILAILCTNTVLVYLSVEFLIIRLKMINKTIISKFKRIVKRLKSNKPIKLNKKNLSTFKTLSTLNNFASQFKEIDYILDSIISRILIGFYIGLAVLPYFLIFSETAYYIKLLIGSLAFLSNLLCFSISIYNDNLKK